jgi:hypothetical protein
MVSPPQEWVNVDTPVEIRVAAVPEGAESEIDVSLLSVGHDAYWPLTDSFIKPSAHHQRHHRWADMFCQSSQIHTTASVPFSDHVSPTATRPEPPTVTAYMFARPKTASS